MSELSTTISFRWEDHSDGYGGHWELLTDCDWHMWGVMAYEQKQEILDSLGGGYTEGDVVHVPLIRTMDPV